MTKDVGAHLLAFATFIWVTVAVGPWWLGALLLLAAICVNLAVALGRRGTKS